MIFILDLSLYFIYIINMENTIITVNVSKETKDQANKILNDLGMNMSTAINIYLKAIINENGIPFLIKNKEK